MLPLWIATLLIATSYKKCYHKKTIESSLHRDTPPDSYIKQNLSLWTINKTLIESAAYLKTIICETIDNNIIKSHKLLMDNAKSFVSYPIHQWKEKFFTIPTENQTPLFLTKNHIETLFSTCCPHIMLNDLPPTKNPQALGIYRHTLLTYDELKKSSNSTALCHNNDYTYKTLTTLHDQTIQTFHTMKILQQSLQSQNQNTTSNRKRSLLDAFVYSGQRLNGLENQLTTMTETFRHNVDI